MLIVLHSSITTFATNNMVFTRATPTKYEKVKRATVVTYLEEKEIPADAVRIGTIMCNVSRNLEKRLTEATNMAALNGGNGIYVLPASSDKTTDRNSGLRIAVYRVNSSN